MVCLHTHCLVCPVVLYQVVVVASDHYKCLPMVQYLCTTAALLMPLRCDVPLKLVSECLHSWASVPCRVSAPDHTVCHPILLVYCICAVCMLMLFGLLMCCGCASMLCYSVSMPAVDLMSIVHQFWWRSLCDQSLPNYLLDLGVNVLLLRAPVRCMKF